MLPLYHTFGISSIFDNMVRGLQFILVPHFTFKNMLEAIQEYRVLSIFIYLLFFH